MKIRIDSKANSKLKVLLTERDEYYIFEGEKLVKDILKKKTKISKLIITKSKESFVDELNNDINEIWIVSDQIMKKISDFKDFSDFVVFIKIVKSKINFSLAQTVVVLDNIQDPANAGTILRCSSAFGIQNIAFTGDCVKQNNRKLLRGSQGAILDINHQSFSKLDDLLKKSEIRNFNVYLTSSKKTVRSLDVEQVNFPCLIIIGNEGQGLSEELFLKYPSLKIPQKSSMESLNAGVSACIIMYEIGKLI